MNSDELKVHKIPRRTSGDGMEKEEIQTLDGVSKRLLRDELIYRPVDMRECHVSPILITGEMIDVIPTLCVRETKPRGMFSKEPKFVPYEPYKAAVDPLISPKSSIKIPGKTICKQNGADMAVIAMNNMKIEENSNPVNSEMNSNWKREKQTLEKEVSQLKKKNTELENEVNYQAQVNSDVKKLLVAAVGEDIEMRVQLLTEDKLHLARQLVNSAKSLSTHQGQIEWLAGQCEVWRSKFLASSFLVEDMAKWKASLNQRVTALEKVIRDMMAEKRSHLDTAFHTFQNLSTLQATFDLDTQPRDSLEEKHAISSDLYELCELNSNLSDMLMEQLLMAHKPVKGKYELNPVHCSTKAEKEASKLLSQPTISILAETDLACSAVMNGAAVAMSASTPCSNSNGAVHTI